MEFNTFWLFLAIALWILLYELLFWYIEPRRLKFIFYSHHNLLITYRWIHRQDLYHGTFSAAVILFLIVASPRLQQEITLVEGLLFVFIIVMLLGILCSSLIGCVNKTTVFSDFSGKIRTEYGPLVGPLEWFRYPYGTITGVKKIYYTKIRGTRLPPIWRYPIWAESHQGNKILLFARIDLEPDAIMVVKKLEQWLAISRSTSDSA